MLQLLLFGCAALLLPFWSDCRTALGPGGAQFEPAVQLCQAATVGGDNRGISLAEQLSLACTDDSLSHDECVPECGRDLHGCLLLLNIDGDDTKLSCELQHGLYSWLGAASEGGFIGSDFASFFSAVVSGAAGSYSVTLTEDAGISTELVVTPGQTVSVVGDPSVLAPAWWV